MAVTLLNLLALMVTFVPMIFAASIPGLSVKAIRAGDTAYTQDDLAFKGTIHGVQVELNGTAESIYSQLTALHPDVVANYNAQNGSLLARSVEDLGLPVRSIEARNKMPPPLCIPVPGQDWGNADAGLIQDGINYLSGLQGGCCVGPTSCVRISCSWNSAIFLCNDNGYTICPNCGYLATYASDMINDCSSWNGGDSIIVGGQLFDSDHYNIIVRWDSC